MLEPKDFKDAITVQDACNLSGVVHSFSRVLPKIWDEAHTKGHGTEWVNTHPISVLYADKINHLTGIQNNIGNPTLISVAWAMCEEQSQTPALVTSEGGN